MLSLMFGGLGCAPPETVKKPPAVEQLTPLPDPNEPPSPITVDDFVKGQILRDSKHSMSRMVGAIPTTEQKLLLEVQIPQAMELFRAQDRKGKYPLDHDSFMKSIIEANQLKLPELRRGYEYWYDGETAQLLKRPAPQPVDDAEQNVEQ